MKRNTHQQTVVLDAMLQLKGCHPAADTVYKKVKQVIPSISRATVYRILNQQADQGVIQKITITNSSYRYDNRLDRHYHMKCSKCARIVDVDIPPIEDLCDKIPASSGAKIIGYDIIFYGLCSIYKCNEIG